MVEAITYFIFAIGVLVLGIGLYLGVVFAYDELRYRFWQLNYKRHANQIGNQIMDMSYWFSSQENIMKLLRKIGNDVKCDSVNPDETRNYFRSLWNESLKKELNITNKEK